MFDIRQTTDLLLAQYDNKTAMRRKVAEDYSAFLLAEAKRKKFSPAETIYVMLLTSGILRNLHNRLDVATIRAMEEADKALKSAKSSTNGLNEQEVMQARNKIPSLLLGTCEPGYTSLYDSVASYVEYYGAAS